MQCMLQNILKEVIFWALLASGDFHNNEVQRPRKALLADAWSEILAGLSELGLTVLTRLCESGFHFHQCYQTWLFSAKVATFKAWWRAKIGGESPP